MLNITKMQQNLLSRNFLACVVICVIDIYLTTAQVCTENGRVVGLDLERQYGDSYESDDTIILDQYGVIICYGVVTEWNFAKSTDCSSVYFQIWRPDGSDYTLVGQNYFDPAKESCDNFEIVKPTTFRIPKHERIPVQPKDIIGWTSANRNSMIKYNQNSAQRVTKLCGDPADDPSSLGFSTANCLGTVDHPAVDVSLQALVVTGPAPVFANLPTTVQIPENSLYDDPSGFPDKWFDVKASIESNAKDPADTTPPNALDVPLLFSFSSPQFYFNITTELDNDNDFIVGTQPYTGRVSIIEPLDYETQDEHIIPIRVYGLGQYAESTLTVQVIDINEPHTITNLPYTTSVNAETANIGDVVFKVEVFDDDAHPDTLIFAINSTDILDPSPPFKMDHKTGILTVSENINEMVLPSQYVLDLVAWDFMYTDVKALTINLTNIRGNPVIRNLDNVTEIPEDAPTWSDIYQVVAESRYPGQIKYSIIGVTPFEMYNKFIIDPQSGWIRTTDNPHLNYGNKSQWPINVEVEVCDDVGKDNGTLTINLTWINRQPLFKPSVYIIDIPEKCGQEDNPCRPNITNPWTIPGLILNIGHRDEGVLPDNPGPADTSHCSILPSFASSIFVVENCIYLLLIDVMDVNAHPEYMTINLTLLVEDDYGLSGTAAVFITVYDINDHAPQFTQSSYSATISENTLGGVSVLTVTAKDDDFGGNATFVYSLSNINDYNGTYYLQIDPFTGVIYTKHPTDFELLMIETGSNVIHFYVRAKDQGINPNSRRRNVSIIVEDVNDNRPIFDCSNKKTYNPVDLNYLCFYNEDIRSDTLAGHTVLTLKAYDAIPENSMQTYYLLNTMKHFALNTTISNTGNLHTIAHPLLVYYKYMMICMVEDQGHPKLKARPPVIVRVDTFPPENHLVDITIDELIRDFNETSSTEAFMTGLYKYIHPWFPRLEGITAYPDRTDVTIYALTDNSTFLYENMDQPKNFVHVNDLLKQLRKNVHGDPRENFIKAMNNSCKPVLVMPTIPNWWIHTLGGLITTFMILLLLTLFPIIVTILLCRYFNLCCYKKRKIRPTTHAWRNDKHYLQKSDDDMSIIRESDKNRYSSDDKRKDDSDDGDHIPFSYSEMGQSKRMRPDSSSTIHSRIYVLSPMLKK